MNASTHCFDKIRSLIRSRIQDPGLPSLAVGVVRDGETLWEEAFGLADREKRVPATIHTRYSLASVSKPFTTTALMKLVEAGQMDLDTPVNEYLAPGCRLNVWAGDPDAVTVRKVATHTAGLPGQCNFFSEDQLYLRPSREESIRRYGNIVTPPGERYRYANFGFGILDHLVERVSGLSFADYLRREVFLPLGMTRSSVDLSSDLRGDAAIRYDADGRPIPYYEVDHPGASSVWTSVNDLLRFGRFHLRQPLADQKAVLSEETILAMQKPAVTMNNVNPADLNLRSTSQYGIGWVVDDDELDFRISHGGGMGGAASKLLLIPKENIVIATAANSFHPLAYTIEREILCNLIPDYCEKFALYDEKKGLAEAAAEQGGATLPVPELTGEWQGALHTYEKKLPFRLSFLPTGEVHAKLGDQLTALVNNVRFANNCLTGKMAGSMETGDAARLPHHAAHHLALDFKLRGTKLNGAVMAMVGNMLSHWAEFEKV